MKSSLQKSVPTKSLITTEIVYKIICSQISQNTGLVKRGFFSPMNSL